MLDKPTQRIPLPHNSTLVLGLATNRAWLHGIRHDRRPVALLSASVLASASRFAPLVPSLAFRLLPSQCPRPGNENGNAEPLIWGLGARGKTRSEAHTVSEIPKEKEALLRAFGEENRLSTFKWETAHGGGFDVLHLT